jgi:hypothetical protein
MAFSLYAAEHPRREQALSAWKYLEKIYQLDSLFSVQQLPKSPYSFCWFFAGIFYESGLEFFSRQSSISLPFSIKFQRVFNGHWEE